MTLRCGFLLFNGFSNMVLASAIEPLRAARDYADPEDYSWQLLSIDGADAKSSSGLFLRADTSLEDARNLDVLFLVAGYGARRHATPAVSKALQLVERRIPRLGGLDCAPWILAAAGLLDGYRSTIHWQELNEFAESYYDISVSTDQYVIDHSRITAGGASTVNALMLKLISDHGGKALAFDVMNMFAYDARQTIRGGDNTKGPASQLQSVKMQAVQLIRAVAAMNRNIENPLPLSQIADHAAVSERTLARLFTRELGIGPGHYYQRIRLDMARALAEETSLSAGEIATRTGFSTASSLSRAFAAHFGWTIRASKSHRRG
ncbi:MULTISPECIES: GlxA family transcriptional regulator [Brucella]|jgi:transcriptional regulator GlxA family with amidase domain|uniref:GlxA family transcriptional regulator n=1 Tax=Brucella TaxID=234 RepID=UPI000CFD25CB|nr:MULTISPECIES: GlxA family transcriptional regulator [Brucella]MQP42565.1 helix-turn-helix domain-containing protein [Ochrobactrum sp. MYb237]PQZ40992.1 AraC family transcriptional regulator [Brucella pseudogrignonensis]PRA37290.1 AraC family transcriptional regulator [Brucella pseudogrignonensis]PRA62196.1 AraC family transcriptional regulator [Brucella pseudogrignonensis]